MYNHQNMHVAVIMYGCIIVLWLDLSIIQHAIATGKRSIDLSALCGYPQELIEDSTRFLSYYTLSVFVQSKHDFCVKNDSEA